MSRLPRLTPRKVVAVLKRAGFVLDRVRGSHYQFYHPAKPDLVLSVPYHTRDLPTGTLHAIIKQAGMTQEEFQRLL